jgi:cyclic beta-1,2-glucan synthetase
MWATYSLEWTIGRTRYRIVVSNPEHRCRGVASATLDGTTVDANAIPVVDDGGTHEVDIVLGQAAQPAEHGPVSGAVFR